MRKNQSRRSPCSRRRESVCSKTKSDTHTHRNCFVQCHLGLRDNKFVRRTRSPQCLIVLRGSKGKLFTTRCHVPTENEWDTVNITIPVRTVCMSDCGWLYPKRGRTNTYLDWIARVCRVVGQVTRNESRGSITDTGRDSEVYLVYGDRPTTDRG